MTATSGWQRNCPDCGAPIMWQRRTSSIVWIVVLSLVLTPLTLGLSLFGLLFILTVNKVPKCVQCGQYVPYMPSVEGGEQ